MIVTLLVADDEDEEEDEDDDDDDEEDADDAEDEKDGGSGGDEEEEETRTRTRTTTSTTRTTSSVFHKLVSERYLQPSILKRGRRARPRVCRPRAPSCRRRSRTLIVPLRGLAVLLSLLAPLRTLAVLLSLLRGGWANH